MDNLIQHSVLKPFLWLLIQVFLLFNIQACDASQQVQQVNWNQDSSLLNIEEEINKAFISTQIQQSAVPLSNIKKLLLKSPNKHIAAYWQNYVAYHEAVFYLIRKDKTNSKRISDKAIKSLEDLENKNSEDFALLALLKSFSIQFEGGMQAGLTSLSAKKNAQKSLKLYKHNLRAYYVLGMVDFYTPEEYGGKKKAEGYLQQAIKLATKSSEVSQAPSWGKNMAYELLIRHYLSVGDKQNANLYLTQGLEKFPDDYQLNRLSSTMK